ncbi:MAG: NAD(P)/FAD-dependent oxidoreductase [Candidatus Heimdallarchaeota archaeon]|nr:NAD(P)/FAD-dependent oxidoreductase [Candidatus Heimdallarchaeota archaeon]
MSKVNSDKIYDAAIVGSGPGGSSTAFYLSKLGRSVVILEKEKLPRRKICGDAISQIAQKHLTKMGVLQEILEEKKGHWAEIGGLISPSRITYIDNSAEVIGSHLMISIKRQIMDEKMVRAAEREGAHLLEEYNVKEVKFSEEDKIWTIVSQDDSKKKIKAKVLVAADGAVSKIARSLGIVDSPPKAVSSSVYIKAGTHQFKEDGVCIYTQDILPGYTALFKEADGDLVFCCYIIPGGRYKTSDLQHVHLSFLSGEPYLSRALGPNAKIEKMNSAPLRLGGVKKSYANHLLIVGDAAGMIDPLTGEGIQYAMDAGEIAANVLDEAFDEDDLSEKFLKRYQKKWMKTFGRDFKWSTRMVKVLAKKPIFIDAFAQLCNDKGPSYMIMWAKIMTGSQSKLSFFKPRLAVPLLLTSLKLSLKKK